MPPPQGRGKGAGRGRGRGKGGGRGRGRGMSPAPRRKDYSESFDIFEEEEDSARPGVSNSPPATGSSGMADDESSTPSGSPKFRRKDRKVSMDELQRSYDFAQDDEERQKLRKELEKLKEEEEQNRIMEESRNRANMVRSISKDSKNRGSTLAQLNAALGRSFSETDLDERLSQSQSKAKQQSNSDNKQTKEDDLNESQNSGDPQLQDDGGKQSEDHDNKESLGNDNRQLQDENLQNAITKEISNKNNVKDIKTIPTGPPPPYRKNMNEEKKRKYVMTWVGRTGGVKNVKKSLKELVKAARTILPPTGTTYSICETFDTYQKGGLYPLFHMSEDSGVINKLLNSDEIDPDILGPENMIDQGLFEEIACITPRMQEESTASESVMAVFCFKSIEPSPHPKLIKEWKQWSGARAFLQDLVLAGLECHKIRFYVKVVARKPEEAQGFYYVLTIEVGIREPSDEGLFVDTLQRFRVERWFGYSTIYRKH
ncbi:uncharacterized protein [Palaemon carinicauda]|uniref:uncharacterized protein n=1 Tax=Palaemon carinicauda TaxID=392227 RepID=UPI0035B60EA2